MPDPVLAGPVGFWGLGNMGSVMARRLLDAGVDVLGFDPTSSAREGLAASGGTFVDGPQALKSATVVILMLPNSKVVEQVLLSDGMADALDAGTLVVDMSSSEPLRTQALSANLERRGLRLVDAPVSGGVRGAEAGTLTIMMGGTEENTDQVVPLLKLLGRPTRVGPIGAGHALKALNNLLSATHLWITSEAMTVGKRFGLDPVVMLDAFNASSGRSGSTQVKWPDFILPGTYNSGFALSLMLKDVKIAAALAGGLGADVPLASAAVDVWSRAAVALPERADHTEVARYLEDATGSVADGASADDGTVA